MNTPRIRSRRQVPSGLAARYVRRFQLGERHWISALYIHGSGQVSATLLERDECGLRLEHQSVHTSVPLAREHLCRALLVAVVPAKVLEEYRQSSALN